MSRRRFAAIVAMVGLASGAVVMATAGPEAATVTSERSMTSAAARASGARFTDVGDSHPFLAPITWLTDQGIAQGYPDGGFHPEAPVTRQAMAAFLRRLAAPPSPPPCDPAAFADVPAGHPFCAEITWLTDQGIAQGYPDGGFHPGAPVTRQAMAAFLRELAAPPSPPPCDGLVFADVTAAHPFCDAITWLVDAGITTGYLDGTFRPAGVVTRQAMAAFLFRYANPDDPSAQGAVDVAAGDAHDCIVVRNGAAQCWGSNAEGQLGGGNADPPASPTTLVTVVGIDDAARIDAGAGHSCAVRDDGTAWCWGRNTDGQAGAAPSPTVLTPAAVPGVSEARRVAVGAAHSCVLRNDGTVLCWGDDTYGQLGNGVPAADSATPVGVDGITNAVSISGGASHTCALLEDATLRCWGRNHLSQLGDGGTADAFTPVAPTGITTATAVAAGGAHSCALLRSSGVRCWGLNSDGQIGDGTTTTRRTPVSPSGLSGVVRITAGAGHTCALRTAGTARCWGRNSSWQLSDRTARDRLSPVIVLDQPIATAIAAGGTHTCVIADTGVPDCWGDDDRVLPAPARVGVYGDSAALGLGVYSVPYTGSSNPDRRLLDVGGVTALGCGVTMSHDWCKTASAWQQKAQDNNVEIALVYAGGWETSCLIPSTTSWTTCRAIGDPVFDAYLWDELTTRSQALLAGGVDKVVFVKTNCGVACDSVIVPSRWTAWWAMLDDLDATDSRIDVIDLRPYWAADPARDAAIRHDGYHFAEPAWLVWRDVLEDELYWYRWVPMHP